CLLLGNLEVHVLESPECSWPVLSRTPPKRRTNEGREGLPERPIALALSQLVALRDSTRGDCDARHHLGQVGEGLLDLPEVCQAPEEGGEHHDGGDRNQGARETGFPEETPSEPLDAPRHWIEPIDHLEALRDQGRGI